MPLMSDGHNENDLDDGNADGALHPPIIDFPDLDMSGLGTGMGAQGVMLDQDNFE